MGKKSRFNWKKPAAIIGGLALCYVFNSAPPNYDNANRYPLPEEISVIETTLDYELREKSVPEMNRDGEVSTIEKIVKTKDIDFSKDFKIKTDRYRLVKDDDWIPSRVVGHINAMFGRLFFWDWDIGWGLDTERSKAALSILENNEDIKDITVRINHNEGFYDWWRMMTQDNLQERNPFLYRITFGTLSSLGHEIWAEFGRGDYYNPLTKTAVLYSNVESISAHELGHHQDFERFSTDWIYSLARIAPPVMLYQELKASTNAKNNTLIEEDNWQFNRYLMPAFATYCLGFYGTIRRWKNNLKKLF